MTGSNLVADRRQFLAALAATLSMPSVALAQSGSGTHAAVRSMVERYVAEKRMANMVVAIGGRKGPPDYISVGRFELGAGPAAGPDTLYVLNSMTKLFVGFAVMALIEDGKLDLDTPVATFFPEFANMRVLTDPENSLATRPATKPLTIRHLVTHTSGLGYASNTTGPLQQLYRAPLLDNSQRLWPDNPHTGPKTLTEYAQAVAKLPLLSEPGAVWKYSIGLDLAVAVVEKITGTPFDRFITQRLFVPLHMNDTFYTVPPEKLARLTGSYVRTETGLVPAVPPSSGYFSYKTVTPTGGGGMVSSANDYARFMAMLLHEGELDGVRVMKTATARAMMSNLLEPGVIANTSYGASGHGAGGRCTIVDTPGGEGSGTFGWTGASNTQAWVDRANGAYIVLMMQVRQWYPNPIYGDFIGAHYTDLAKAAARR